MFKIIKKEKLAKDITLMEVEAGVIAQKARAGQFVVVVTDEEGERIPLTLADWDVKKGTISIIFQEVGYTTRRLARFNTGDSIAHILGPLGKATDVKKTGNVICIGGGVGIAEVYPVSRAIKNAGNSVTGIIGCRNKELLILEEKMRGACDNLYVTTDDGSYGEKGFVTDVLKRLLETNSMEHGTWNMVYAIGPVPMMKAVADVTRKYNIPAIVSLNPIMVDATGMCGSCRCTVEGKTVFGCVDGPEFDAHQVDFDELQKRLILFKAQEKQIQ